MRIANKRGFYISNSRKNALLFEVPPDIRDSWWFENPKEISKEQFEKYMKEIK